MTEENKVRDAADAVKGIFEAVPIYPDLLQPAAKELGTGLQTIAKTVHIALAPIAAFVWGYEQIKEYVTQAVAKRLKQVPPERIITPSPIVAGPTLEALRFTGHDPTLRELYANLLATSMDADTAAEAHPAFVEILKQLTPDEARVLKYLGSSNKRIFPVINLRANIEGEGNTGAYVIRNFSVVAEEASCVCTNLGQIYLENLCRLQLTEIPENYQVTDQAAYVPLENHQDIQSWISRIDKMPDRVPHIERKSLLMTTLGFVFYKTCILEQDGSNSDVE